MNHMQEIEADNRAIREEIARAQKVLDDAGVEHSGQRLHERVARLVESHRKTGEVAKSKVIAARDLRARLAATTDAANAALARETALRQALALIASLARGSEVERIARRALEETK